MAVSGALTGRFSGRVVVVLIRGIGVWGVNTTVVWGFAIADYVWWIGIGNAGTLISSMLLLMRQKWRASTNRFAEAMTLFAATIAGIFPIIHLGRPMYFYWLTPYPNTMTVWPQWRSALIWDFWAILSYILFSIIFWYVGLIPDLATMRDRAREANCARPIYGALALGWRGSARHWQAYEDSASRAGLSRRAARRIAAQRRRHGFRREPDARLAGDDFPALFRRRRDVFRLRHGGVPRRSGALGLSHAGLITVAHFDVMAKVMLAASIIMGLSYATEWFNAWYGGDHADRSLVVFEFTGAYAPLFWALLLCNVDHSAGVLVRARCGSSVIAVFAIAVVINIGMWLERILIVWNTLSHDYCGEHVAAVHPHGMGLARHVRLARLVRADVSRLRAPRSRRCRCTRCAS